MCECSHHSRHYQHHLLLPDLLVQHGQLARQLEHGAQVPCPLLQLALDEGQEVMGLGDRQDVASVNFQQTLEPLRSASAIQTFSRGIILNVTCIMFE